MKFLARLARAVVNAFTPDIESRGPVYEDSDEGFVDVMTVQEFRDACLINAFTDDDQTEVPEPRFMEDPFLNYRHPDKRIPWRRD